MNAFHTNWTKPFFARNREAPYSMEDYEILMTMLSALLWRKYNGSIKMVTDKAGAEYYHKLGIAHIWDLGIEASLDNAIGDTIDPFPFWAAGKISALMMEAVPCAMIDTDFIVWKPLAAELSGTPLAVIHREGISDGIYPGKSFFDMGENYQFPAQWDWTVLPCNTAFLYIAENDFKAYYTAESIRFMRNVRTAKDITVEMVFAEQRLLAMCAAEKGMAIKSLLDTANLETQDCFTHLWGLKNELRTKPEERRLFCGKCVKRILRDFPEEDAVLGRIPQLKPYLDGGQ